MIIRKKLRPKELQEFDLYFGNLKKLVAKDFREEELRELKFSAMNLNRFYMVNHDEPTRKDTAMMLWDRVQQIFYNEMNEFQRERVEEYELLTKIALAISGKTIHIKDAYMKLARSHTIDIILEAFNDKTFLENVFIEVKAEAYLPIIRMIDLYGVNDFEITKGTDLSRIILPDQILSKIENIAGRYAEQLANRITYYIIIILDILDKGWESVPLLWVVMENRIFREMLFDNIMMKLPKERVAFWKELTIDSRHWLYDCGLFSASKIQDMEKYVIDIKTECNGKHLQDENLYFNLAQAIIVHDENLLAIYFTLTKEEKNIVRNEAVVMARKIKEILLEVLEDFDVNYVYKNPVANEDILNVISFFFQMFYFTRPIMANEMEKRGVDKADWKFIESLLLLKIKEDKTPFITDKKEQKLKEAVEETLFEITINDIKQLDSKVKTAKNKMEALNALLGYASIQKEKHSSPELLKEVTETSMKTYKEGIRREVMQFSLNNLSTKNADLDKSLKVLEALDNGFISKAEFSKAQQKMGVKEKYIEMFFYFYLPYF